MKDSGLKALQGEFRDSRDVKVRKLHSVWRPILDEYGLDSFSDVWMHIQRYKNTTDQDTWLAGQGRVGSLNVLCRKMSGLVSLRDPEFLVDNSNPWDEPIAAVLEHSFEANRRAVGWNGEMKKATVEAVLFGTGMVKTGYGSEFMFDEPAWSGTMPTGGRSRLDSTDQVMPYGLSTETTNFRVQEGMAMMTQVPVADIFYNKGVKREQDIRRIYHRVRRPLVDVLHDSRYNVKARKEAETVRWGDTSDQWLQIDPFERDTEFVEVIECFDLPSRQFCVFTEHASVALRDWTLFPFPVQSPYHRFVPIPHPTNVWGIPYALLILGQAQAMNRLRAVIIDQISRDGKKVHVGDADRVDEPTRLQFEGSRDGDYIWIPGLTPDSPPPFTTLEFGGASPEILELVRIIERDQAWVSGLTDATRNDTGGGDETATAVQNRQEQQSLTVDEFVAANETFQEGVATDVMKIQMVRWDASKLVKVMGPDPNIYFWTQVNLNRVLGSFTLKVVAGSSVKRDRATQRKQWQELMPVMLNIIQWLKQEQMEAAQGAQAAAAAGQPPPPPSSGPVDWHQILRETFDLYDPTLARRILRPDNTAMLVQRLMEQYQESPLYMSPDLERQVMGVAGQPVMQGMSGPAAGQEGLGRAVPSMGPMGGAMGGGMPGGNVVPFEVANGVPGAQSVNPQTGGNYSETPGMVGRV